MAPLEDISHSSPEGLPALSLESLSELMAHDDTVETLAEGLAASHEETNDDLCIALVGNLTSLQYPREEARLHWNAIVEHKYLMSEKLGRNVGIRVAALDYVTNILGRFSRARILEPTVFARLHEAATLDPLTKLGNRRTFRQRLAEELSRSRRHRRAFSIVVFDIDNFKRVNDTKGHVEGDRILCAAASLIQDSIRITDHAARWGGEEFAVIMPETSKRMALIVADRIRRRVEADLAGSGVTISGGLSTFPADGTDADSLFDFADRNLYRAKAAGKNRIVLFPSERRRSSRLAESLAVRFVERTDISRASEAVTYNISTEGIAFRLGQPMTVGSDLRGIVETPERALRFSARVVRVEPLAEEGFEIGVRFLDPPGEKRTLLN